jgi:hypothetical protein
MKPFKPNREMEITIADDDSLPEAQVAHVGLRPGDRIRVVATSGDTSDGSRLAGSLPDPDISWDDFERASALAIADMTPSGPL